ncbi:MAG: FkbM family methyltransferase, partial [Candidatus Jordarchaeum sp.]|uniref:FkbM family methyltransferase n=1 Tax=Candidatus Jordarchaeum sp. TaxID=2823881 RepID=UPI00404B0372
KINESLMYLMINDSGISKDLLLYKIREPLSTQMMKRIIKDDDVIIDIGANLGYYALLEAKFARNGKVFAIEPVPSNVDLLIKNTKLNKYSNIKIFQYAIGDKNGKEKMYISNKSNWASLTKISDTNIINVLDVPVITLDTFVKRFVDKYPTLVRMDVEGYEYNIIKGAKKLLESNKPLRLFIEFHPHLISKDKIMYILHIMEKNNFKIEAIYKEIEMGLYNKIELLNKILKKAEPGIQYGDVKNSPNTLLTFIELEWPVICFFKR